MIEYRSAFVVPLVHHLSNAHVPAAGERDKVQEIDVIGLRHVHNYSIGPCYSIGFCGGRNIIGPQGGLPFRIPRGFKLTDEGQTSLFTYRRYLGPRPVELPPAPPLVKAIAQSPS